MRQYYIKTLCAYYGCAAYGLIIMWAEIMRHNRIGPPYHNIFSKFVSIPLIHVFLFLLLSLRMRFLKNPKNSDWYICDSLKLNSTRDQIECTNFSHTVAFVGECRSAFISSAVLFHPLVLNRAEQRRTRAAPVSELSKLWLGSALLQWLREQAFAAKIPSKGTRKATVIQLSSHICLH